jgi:hypothetical protein
MEYTSFMDTSTCAIFLKHNVNKRVLLEFKEKGHSKTNAVVVEQGKEEESVGGAVRVRVRLYTKKLRATIKFKEGTHQV